MHVSMQTRDCRTTVVVTGELDLHAGRNLAAALTTLLADGQPIEIDASGVDFMDSAALAALQGLMREAAGRGIPVALVSESPAIQRIVGLTGTGVWTRAPAAPPPA